MATCVICGRMFSGPRQEAEENASACASLGQPNHQYSPGQQGSVMILSLKVLPVTGGSHCPAYQVKIGNKNGTLTMTEEEVTAYIESNS